MSPCPTLSVGHHGTQEGSSNASRLCGQLKGNCTFGGKKMKIHHLWELKCVQEVESHVGWSIKVAPKEPNEMVFLLLFRESAAKDGHL
jgi:hypothetical protein